MARPLSEAPFVDFLNADPDELEALGVELRRQTAVVRMPLGASVHRREEVRALLGDPRLVSSIPMLVQLQGVSGGLLQEMVSSSVISTDGDEHTRLRRLVSR